MAASCERCGSVRLARARQGPMDRLRGALTGQRLWVCRRCGWRARRAWRAADVPVLPERGGAEHAWADPTLAGLDGTIGAREQEQGTAQAGAPRSDIQQAKGDQEEANQKPGAGSREPAGAPQRLGHAQQARRRRRRRRSRRRQVVGAVAATAAALGLFTLLGLARGCTPTTEEREE